MPQTFHVLLCVVCKSYQVQIVKKSSNKWNCKICDSKQSVQQVYATGTGAECRTIVQRLNEARGKREETLDTKALERVEQEQEACEYFTSESDCVDGEYPREESCTFDNQIPRTSGLHKQKAGVLCVPPEKSKWTVFLED